MATGSVLKILERSKSDVWMTKEKLFESMVRCVDIYGAEVWGLRYLEILETGQNYFFKRVLSLPASTPGYAIRVEAGRVKLSHVVLKSTLRWLGKIKNMADNRYPRMCCNKIFKLAKQCKKSNNKYNWVLQIISIVEDVPLTRNLNMLDMDVLIEKTNSILEHYELYLRVKDRERVEASTSLQIYPYLPSGGGAQFHLKVGLPMAVSRLLSQIRLSLTRRHVIRHKKENFSIDSNRICSLCNLQEKETIIHILSECPFFFGLRNLNDGELSSGLSEGESWMDLLISDDRDKLRVLSNCILKALRARSLLV